MKYPYIGLVTACYNHKDYIKETIESVLSQEYPYLRYVVIDDGSTDGSWDIIQEYAPYLYHCERMEGFRDTPTIALNHGFSKLPKDVDVMGWLNSDDVLLPKSLFTVAEAFMDNEDVPWLTGMATTINYRSRIVNSILRKKNKYEYLLGDWKVIQQESTFWRKEIWDKVGAKLNGEKKWAFDTELWTRFFEIARHWHLAAPVGAFRSGKQSKSVAKPSSFLLPNLAHLKAMRQRATFGQKLLARIYWVCKKILWPVLGFIPHRYCGKLPLFKRFSYPVLEYSYQEDKWRKTYHNPFRKT